MAYCVNKSLFSGVSETSFAPQTQMNRAMLVTVLYRMAGSPEVSAQTSFTDLNADWYKNAVIWAQENDITKGVSETRFDPESSVTREQTAALLSRYAEKINKADTSVTGDLSAFKDADQVHDWAKDSLIWANTKGIIRGYQDSTVRPQNSATRAEMAQMLMQFCEMK